MNDDIDRRGTCKTCVFWGDEEYVTMKFCHRFPPDGVKWPQTRATHWCGEHKEGGS
jgi:hypothetical protein